MHPPERSVPTASSSGQAARDKPESLGRDRDPVCARLVRTGHHGGAPQQVEGDLGDGALGGALAETKLAAWFVGQIGLLYAVEKKLREQKAGPQLRAAMRAWQSRPELQRLRRAME